MPAAAPTSVGGWDRRCLLAVLASSVIVAALLLFGLAYAVYATVTAAADHDTDPARSSAATSEAVSRERGPAHRDEIAATPMLTVSPDASRGGTPASTLGPTITIPPSTRIGPGQIPTGFPKTPEGAIGQLAGIEVSVLQAMSIPQATLVYTAWAIPGGVGAADWQLTRNVQAFLGDTSVGRAKAITTTVTATPVAAQVKGTDGAGWTLACALLSVRAVITTEAQIAYGYCERMQWVGGVNGQWMIAPGTPPVPAPSTWPGTALSFRAGWRTWTQHGVR